MSRESLPEAKAELYALLSIDGVPTFTVEGIAASNIRVWDHERREYPHPFSITISTVGMDPDFWFLAVRIYVATKTMDDKKAQEYLDLLIPAVNSAIAGNGGFGPSAWTVEWVDQPLLAFMATNLLSVGREDMGDVGY